MKNIWGIWFALIMLGSCGPVPDQETSNNPPLKHSSTSESPGGHNPTKTDVPADGQHSTAPATITLYCNRKTSATGRVLEFSYKSVEHSNGERYVYCSVKSGPITSSDYRYYRADQIGANNGGLAILDPNVDAGWFFTSEGEITKTYFLGPGSPFDFYTVYFARSDCKTF